MTRCGPLAAVLHHHHHHHGHRARARVVLTARRDVLDGITHGGDGMLELVAASGNARAQASDTTGDEREVGWGDGLHPSMFSNRDAGADLACSARLADRAVSAPVG